MNLWEPTHGVRRGAYLQAGASQLYVREDRTKEGLPTGLWAWYVDGILMGVEKAEPAARAASEAAVRAMSRTHTGRMAASTREAGHAA